VVIQSVDRAIRILNVLKGARLVSLKEIAGRLDLPASTTHGIIKTLVAHGMVEQESDSGRYKLGPAVLLLGNVYLDTLELRTRSIRWAEEVAKRTGYAVRVGVLLSEDVVIIHHEPRPDGTRQMPEVGIVIPAHASALGKAILARRSSDADRLLGRTLNNMTGETIVDPDEFRKELATVRVTGIANERDEAVLGESGQGAPILGPTGEVIGAIEMVFTSGEWPIDEAATVALRESARNISRELGAPPFPPET
jgi:DNA-binding IclR family transcriptional regulator